MHSNTLSLILVVFRDLIGHRKHRETYLLTKPKAFYFHRSIVTSTIYGINTTDLLIRHAVVLFVFINIYNIINHSSFAIVNIDMMMEE